MVDEYSHWLDWRFGTAGARNENLGEQNAYKAQIDGSEFSKTTSIFQSHTIRMYNYYRNQHLLDTRGYTECKNISEHC